MITEYDLTKKMLNKLRGYNGQNTQNRLKINEAEETDSVDTEKQLEDVLVVNDVEINMLSSDKDDMGLEDDQKQKISQLIDGFRQQVSQIVEFEPGMTIAENQIRLDGSLTDLDINFVFIAGTERGLYINSDMLKLDDDVMEALQKLSKFEDTFKTTVEPLITQRSNN